MEGEEEGEIIWLKSCLTSTETISLIRDGEKKGEGGGGRFGGGGRGRNNLVEELLYVHRNRRLIRDGSPRRPPRLSHTS